MDVWSRNLPTGFRFSPSNVELIDHFLRLKNKGKESEVELIPEVDICKWEPWELPGLSVIKNGDPEWYFFCRCDHKYPKGRRSNRATESGFWKATGKIREIKYRKKLIGIKKSLIFHRGRAPNGERTNWRIHEYRMNSAQDKFVLCRLFDKDEKPESSNSEERELTGSSPTATISSPEGMPSNHEVVQATSESDLQVKGQSAGIESWPDDKSDNISSGSLVPEKGHDNNSMTSHLIDHATEVGIREVNPLLGEDLSLSHLPTLETPDDRDEHDPNFNEFLENLIIDPESDPGFAHISMLDVIVGESKSGSDVDNIVAQEQNHGVEVQLSYGNMDIGCYLSEFEDGNTNSLLNDYVGHDASSSDSATYPFPDLFNSHEESITHKNSFINQGNARRRIRLQRKLSRRAVLFEDRETSCNAKDSDEEQQVSFVEVKHNATDVVHETSLIDSEINKEKVSCEPNAELRLGSNSRRDGVMSECRQPRAKLANVPPCRSSFSSQYTVHVATVVFLFMVFVGIWRCLKY